MHNQGILGEGSVHFLLSYSVFMMKHFFTVKLSENYNAVWGEFVCWYQTTCVWEYYADEIESKGKVLDGVLQVENIETHSRTMQNQATCR